jgi:hypothetical protein
LLEDGGVFWEDAASADEANAVRETLRRRKAKQRQEEMLMEPSNRTAYSPGQLGFL